MIFHHAGGCFSLEREPHEIPCRYPLEDKAGIGSESEAAIVARFAEDHASSRGDLSQTLEAGPDQRPSDTSLLHVRNNRDRSEAMPPPRSAIDRDWREVDMPDDPAVRHRNERYAQGARRAQRGDDIGLCAPALLRRLKGGVGDLPDVRGVFRTLVPDFEGAAQGHFATGGSDISTASGLCPVSRPNRVPRS